MINIHIVRDKEGFIWEFSVSGHAEYSERGSDIVCAAVSVLTQTTVAALEELVGLKKYQKREGKLRCSIPIDILGEEKYKAGIILETMAIGLRQLKRSYRKYIAILDEEV
jgi:uncharacterized protein